VGGTGPSEEGACAGGLLPGGLPRHGGGRELRLGLNPSAPNGAAPFSKGALCEGGSLGKGLLS